MLKGEKWIGAGAAEAPIDHSIKVNDICKKVFFPLRSDNNLISYRSRRLVPDVDPSLVGIQVQHRRSRVPCHVFLIVFSEAIEILARRKEEQSGSRSPT